MKSQNRHALRRFHLTPSGKSNGDLHKTPDNRACEQSLQVGVGVAGNGLLLVCRFRAAQSRPASAWRRNSEIRKSGRLQPKIDVLRAIGILRQPRATRGIAAASRKISTSIEPIALSSLLAARAARYAK